MSNYHGSACLNATGGIGGKGCVGIGSKCGGFSCIQSPLAAITAANVGGSTTGASVLKTVTDQVIGHL